MMNCKLFITLGLALMLSPLWATSVNIDIYGVDEEIQRKIMQCCQKDLIRYVKLRQQINLNLKRESNEELIQQQHDLEKSVIAKINLIAPFILTNISTVYYPQNQTTYTTIDLVKKSERNRLPVSAQRSIIKPLLKPPGLQRLFQLWETYDARNMQLMHQPGFSLQNKKCPIEHCTWGFDAHELAHELPLLIRGAKEYKKQLTTIIAHSDNDKDREEALFILAHHNDYMQLALFLTQYTSDSSQGVRNNAMRILGAILAKHPLKQLSILPILQALDYPYVTDRNKAAYVLFGIIQQNKSFNQLIIDQSGDTLLQLLRLKQPNNHDFAYHILTELSQRHYKERDYVSWQQWLDEEKNKSSVRTS